MQITTLIHTLAPSRAVYIHQYSYMTSCAHIRTHMHINHIFQRAVAYNMGMQQHVTNGMPVALCGSPYSRVRRPFE